MSEYNPLIISGRSAVPMTARLAHHLNAEIKPVIRKRFPDGEVYTRIDVVEWETLNGRPIVINTHTRTDEDFSDLIRLVYALHNLNTGPIKVNITWFGYSTMERIVKPGECPAAKVNIDILSNLPGDITFIFTDLHAPAILQYFSGNHRRFELKTHKVLVQAVRDLELEGPLTFASADMGRVRDIVEWSTDFPGSTTAFIAKGRDGAETKIAGVDAAVKDRTVIIYDDCTRSGGTLLHAAEAYLEGGATAVYAVLSHLALNDKSVVQRIGGPKSPFTGIITTDSHPMSETPEVRENKRFTIIPLAEKYANLLRENAGV